MKIQFCGAAQEVTGSAHLLTLDSGYKILLDCGLFQGFDDRDDHNENWYFNPAEIDCVVLSHAHIDHSGRLPKLVRDGFNGIIHSTHATRSLCSIMLLDSAHIQEKDAEYYNKRLMRKGKGKGTPLRKPLYTSKDVKPAMELFATYGYDHWFSIHPDVDVLFRDAGHILGSASVTLRIREDGKTILFGFTGDVGRPDRPILRDPKPMPEVDILLCESTYGDRVHEGKPEETDHLLKIIKDTCVERRGKLIIPAFSVGRTQEIVYMLDKMESAGVLPQVPVFVDSPLAVNATMIFGSHPECFDNDLNEYMLIDEDPFGFNRLTYVRSVEMSKQLNVMEEPCIIISSSGMMNAGRILHHTKHDIDDPRNTFLLVGYCSPETPCGQLQAGKEYLKVFGETKPVKARIERMESFSAHGDRNELLDFVKNQAGRVKAVYLVHGNLEAQQSFRRLLLDNGFDNVMIPNLGETVKT